MLETIAHEIAHAVVNSLLLEYNPALEELKAGHGPIHDDFQQRIEKYMKTTSAFKSFEKW